MTFELRSHPISASIGLDRLTVSIERVAEGRLRLRYEVEGRLGYLVLPAPAEPARTDGLWEATCFELFLRGGGNDYLEFNFAPSGQWAAYRFDGYRSGMMPAPLLEPPRIQFETDGRSLVMEVELAVDLPEGPLDVGLTAVIEELGGLKTWWSLRHGGDKPDFHHPVGFAGKLSASSPRT